MIRRILAGTAALMVLLPAAPARAHEPPATVTRSFYMETADLGKAAALGCDQAGNGRSGRMTLFFGAPVRLATSGALNDQFGATLWGAPDRTLNQIEEIVKWFVIGYDRCRTGTATIHVGIGTSNSGIDDETWIRTHGQAWSISVKNLNAWATAHYRTAAAIYGGYDAEPGWATYQQTLRWMQGYAFETSTPRPLHLHASADGCPQETSDNGACDNGWTQANLWHLAAGIPVSLAMPQIYAEEGGNADQWAMISRYGAENRNRAVDFVGLMTQHGACHQGSCPAGTDNTWDRARDQLVAATQGAYDGEGLTDIRWYTGS